MVDFSPLFENLRSQGYTPAAAAGILGNFGQESGFNPAVIGDNGTSGGLGQWHNERFANLKNYAAGQGQPWQSPLVQLGFADREIRSDPRLFEALQAAKTPTQAADIFSARFERPNPAFANNAHREALAEQINQGQGPTADRARAVFGSVGLPAAAPAPAGPSPLAQTGGNAPAPQPNPWADLARTLTIPQLGRAPTPVVEQPQQPAADPAALARAITAGLPGNLVLT